MSDLTSRAAVKRQVDTAALLLPLLQTFNFDPNVLRPLVCNSEALSQIVHFNNISVVSIINMSKS